MSESDLPEYRLVKFPGCTRRIRATCPYYYSIEAIPRPGGTTCPTSAVGDVSSGTRT